MSAVFKSDRGEREGYEAGEKAAYSPSFQPVVTTTCWLTALLAVCANPTLWWQRRPLGMASEGSTGDSYTLGMHVWWGDCELSIAMSEA